MEEVHEEWFWRNKLKFLSQLSAEKIEKDQTQEVVCPDGLHCAIFKKIYFSSEDGNTE